MVDKLLLERLALAAIVRVTGVSARWLQIYVNEKYENTPQEVEVTLKKPGKLTVQLDEMWSFVGYKKNNKWIWLAIDADTREIVGAYIGDRSRHSAKKLWLSIPAVYCQCAVFIRTFGKPTQQYCLANDIKLWVKKQVRPAILRESTILSVKELED